MQMQTLLYSSQLTPEAMQTYSRELKLSPYADKERLACGERVLADLKLGKDPGLSDTPSLFLVKSGRVFRI